MKRKHRKAYDRGIIVLQCADCGHGFDEHKAVETPSRWVGGKIWIKECLHVGCHCVEFKAIANRKVA